MTLGMLVEWIILTHRCSSLTHISVSGSSSMESLVANFTVTNFICSEDVGQPSFDTFNAAENVMQHMVSLPHIRPHPPTTQLISPFLDWDPSSLTPSLLDSFLALPDWPLV